MIRYLLDTNIVSDLIRNPQGSAASRIGEVGEDSVATSIIVAAEVRFGAQRRNSSRLTQQVESVLGVLPVLPFGPPADSHYGVIRAELEHRGMPIGGNDMLIAAQALADDYTLVTDNLRDFERVAGLKVENWLR